jgi:chromosome segregation ATPase
MEETKLLAQYAPHLIGFAGALLLLFITVRLIIFVKKELFSGVISLETHTAQIERERKAVEATENVSNQLSEIVSQLASLTEGVKEEIQEMTERLRSLEHAMSDYLEAFHELNRNFEMHRRGYTDTEQLRLTK